MSDGQSIDILKTERWRVCEGDITNAAINHEISHNLSAISETARITLGMCQFPSTLLC